MLHAAFNRIEGLCSAVKRLLEGLLKWCGLAGRLCIAAIRRWHRLSSNSRET